MPREHYQPQSQQFLNAAWVSLSVEGEGELHRLLTAPSTAVSSPAPPPPTPMPSQLTKAFLTGKSTLINSAKEWLGTEENQESRTSGGS